MEMDTKCVHVRVRDSMHVGVCIHNAYADAHVGQKHRIHWNWSYRCYEVSYVMAGIQTSVLYKDNRGS